jgi:hypothetical protein
MNIIIMELYSFYKIQCKDETVTETYIGSTVNLKVRNKCHKSTCGNPKSENYNIKLYKYIREHGGWTNWSMIEIETCKYETKLDARIKETELMVEYKSNLNTNKAYISPEQKKENKKIYNKKYSKKYRYDNKEIIKASKNKYYQDNKETIRKLLGKKCVCECGMDYTHNHKSRHIKSIKHQTFIQTNNQNLEIK